MVRPPIYMTVVKPQEGTFCGSTGLYNAGMTWDNIASFVAVLGFFLTAVALVFEERRARTIHEVQVLMQYNELFDSTRMHQHRVRASKFLLNPSKPEESHEDWEVVADILSFYQMLGNIVRLRHVRIELAYKDFFYWLSHYGKACTTYIVFTQSKSPITFSDASWLHAKLLKYDRRANNGTLSNPSPYDLQTFFEREIALYSD